MRRQLEQLEIAGLTADQWLVATLLVGVQHYAVERDVDLRTMGTAEIIAWARRATRAEA
jgi:hypothetical protein